MSSETECDSSNSSEHNAGLEHEAVEWEKACKEVAMEWEKTREQARQSAREFEDMRPTLQSAIDYFKELKAEEDANLSAPQNKLGD